MSKCTLFWAWIHRRMCIRYIKYGADMEQMLPYQIVIIAADVENFSAASESNCRFYWICCVAGACGRRLRRHDLRITAPCLCGIYRSGNSTIALFKSLSKKVNIKNRDQVSPVKSVSPLLFEKFNGKSRGRELRFTSWFLYFFQKLLNCFQKLS
jgi:hypothetical protein